MIANSWRTFSGTTVGGVVTPICPINLNRFTLIVSILNNVVFNDGVLIFIPTGAIQTTIYQASAPFTYTFLFRDYAAIMQQNLSIISSGAVDYNVTEAFKIP